MNKQDQLFSKKLQREMNTVSFSEEQKKALSRHLKDIKVEETFQQTIKPNSEQSISLSILQKIIDFWNGTTEVSLSTGAVVASAATLLIWSSVGDFILIDTSTALLLLQNGKETITAIEQGVSLL